MQTFDFYRDQKCSVWTRTSFRIEAETYEQAVAKVLEMEENDDYDPLMRVFGITPSLKRENRQYWGRELGMCWQRLVTEVFKANCLDYQPALKIADDQPCEPIAIEHVNNLGKDSCICDVRAVPPSCRPTSIGRTPTTASPRP